MQDSVTAPRGNAKLRALLQRSRRHLWRRELKKAVNTAQIAADFAGQSGEDPAVVGAARLVIAEALLTNAAYTSDEELRRQGWRIIEQLDADGAGAAGAPAVDPTELALAKALAQGRHREYDTALATLARLVEDLPAGHAATARTLVARAFVAAEGAPAEASTRGFLAAAAEALPDAPAQEHAMLTAGLSLARSYAARAAGDYGAATDEAQRAARAAAAAEMPEATALANLQLGRLIRGRGNHAIALRLLYEALDASQAIGYDALATDARLEIGLVYASIYNDDEAAKHFREVLDAARRHARTPLRYTAALALGRTAAREGDHEGANAYLTEALQAARESDSKTRQATALGELAATRLSEGQACLADHLAQEAAGLLDADEATDTAHRTRACIELTRARIAQREGQTDVARSSAERAVASAKDAGAVRLLTDGLRLKADLLAAAGDFAGAYAEQQLATKLALRLVDQQRSRHLPNLDMRAALREREQEIEKLTREAELKNAIVAKNDEIERANRDLMIVNEELRQFAYVASHDLKEPVRQIGSYVSLIRRKYAAGFDESGRTFLGFVTEGVERLNRLLDSLVHYAAVARMEMAPRSVGLADVLEGVERELADPIAAVGATVTRVGELPTLRTSPEMLHAVLYAVLDNAVKFSREGEAPRIEVAADADGPHYRVAVRDNGVGIDPAYHDKVFVLFQMLEAKAGAQGTGVGMAIAQKTMQRLGGRIWFEPNPAGLPGTTFYLTLPGDHEG